MPHAPRVGWRRQVAWHLWRRSGKRDWTGWRRTSGRRSISQGSVNGSSRAKRGLFVRGGGSAGDVHDINVLLLGVDVKKDPIRAHAAPPGGTFRGQAHNVARKRV